MRGILFRGFHPDKNGTEKVLVNGKFIKGFWAYGDLRHRESSGKCFVEIITKCDGYDNYKYFYVIPETVGQYTRLKDKNGKKIFANDIVKNDWCFVKGNSIVKFGEYKTFDMSNDYPQGHLGFYLEHINEINLKTTRKDILFFANNCEIIGNIYSNPELLEE